MKSNNIFIVLLLSSIFSCKTEQTKKNIVDTPFETVDTIYYDNGKINYIVQEHKIADLLKRYEKYYDGHILEVEQFTYSGFNVGPAKFYDSSGAFALYNETDFNKDIYYVKKYKDSKLIKEEGVPLSPNYFSFTGDSLHADSLFQITVCYAQPDDYTNEIHFYINDSLVEHHALKPAHLAYISRYLNPGLNSIKVTSKLITHDGVLYEDSIIKKIQVYR